MARDRLILTWSCAGALALAAAAPVTAQTASADGDKLEEITVTAQRRAEKLQDVPISMSAVSGATLENLGFTSFSDYAGLIPNLAVGSGAGAGGAGNGFGVSSTRAVAIRGVAGNNTTALYLNDTPIPISVDPRVIDVDRVEVLRGPQGTLFGAGSMGGTVRLVTRDPSAQDFYGKVLVEGSYANHGGGGYSANSTFNIPVIKDNVAVRLSAFSSFDPGLYTRTWGGPLDPRSPSLPYPPGGAPVGEKAHVGATQSTGFTATVGITPTAVPGLSVTPMFMYQRSNSNGYPLADYAPNDFTQTRPLNVPEAVTDTWSFGGLTIKQDTSFGRFIGFGTYFYRNAYDLEDTTDINAITFWGLPYYVPAPLQNAMLTKTWTGEARFESAIPGPVQFVVGVFDEVSERNFNEYYNAPGLNAASGGTLGTDLEYTQGSPNADRQRAAFLDVTYKVTDEFAVSAGVRRAYLAHEGTYVADGPLNGGPSFAYAEHGERNTAPRYTAKYTFAPGQMLYASAAKGFRIGGTNALLPPRCDADLAALGLSNGQPFHSDSLWSFEVGSKNSFDNDRIRTRLAAYRIDWKGLQQSIYLQCTFNTVANSGAAVSKGAELEVDLAVINHLTVNLAAGYEDAQITEATSASATVVGQPLNDVPKWSGSVIAQYVIPLGERQGFVRGDYTYTGKR
ncbi:MAG: TonB-dependent receptor, partial [Gammaproteobacteria bacterium]|nr:TonB-dependent receptor [Gammaproteobacteria bacterium]